MRASLEKEGWHVYDTLRDFPELFAVKGIEIQFVKIPRETENMEHLKQRKIIEDMQARGVKVTVIPRTTRPDHTGGRIITSVYFGGDDIMAYQKLLQILRIQGKSFNEFVRDQVYEYVSETMKSVG